ncbi:transporter [Candidatus Sumerlaeota bacterium]|nr:transporter [Candidatus Sumerlaeota bacterium]
MLFLLDFQVEYPTSMGQKDLFEIWVKEADAALEAKKAGMVVDLWKCAGTRRIIAVVDVKSHDDLDHILLDLPIMVEHGQHVQVEISPLRRYEDFATDVKQRIKK